MPDPLDTLMSEHRVIERVLEALVSYGRDVARGDAKPDRLAAFVRFFSEYADDHHHGKEEQILFDLMVRNGFPGEAGPIAVMRSEHDTFRGWVRRLSQLAGAESWSAAERTEIVDLVEAYGQGLHAHIEKEDEILFPMARSHVAPGVYDEITVAFEKFDDYPAQRQKCAELLALSKALTGDEA